MKVLEVSDIFYTESYDHEIYVYTKDNKHTKVGKIGKEEETLANYSFVRSYRNAYMEPANIIRLYRNGNGQLRSDDYGEDQKQIDF